MTFKFESGYRCPNCGAFPVKEEHEWNIKEVGLYGPGKTKFTCKSCGYSDEQYSYSEISC